MVKNRQSVNLPKLLLEINLADDLCLLQIVHSSVWKVARGSKNGNILWRNIPSPNTPGSKLHEKCPKKSNSSKT